MHPSRFSGSTSCLWLAKAYLPAPEGISTWVGPTALSGKPPLDSVQIQKCQESEISTSSRWQPSTPSTLAWADGELPGSLRQRQARLEGKPGCQWSTTQQNDQGMEGGTDLLVSTVPSQQAFSCCGHPSMLALLPSNPCLKVMVC